MPNERTRAVQYTREFLSDLIEPLVTPGVPQEIREQARRLLRHYPADFYFKEAAAHSPDTWGPPEPGDQIKAAGRKLLLSFFTMAGLWQLDEQAAAELLGASLTQFRQLKAWPHTQLAEETRQRIVHLLNIHRSLELLFDNDMNQAESWLTTVSDEPVFGGKTPLALMRQGGKEILETSFLIEEKAYPALVVREIESRISWFSDEYRPEADRRLAQLKQGIADGRLEGLPVSYETLAVFEKYVLLDIDAEELQQQMQDLQNASANQD